MSHYLNTYILSAQKQFRLEDQWAPIGWIVPAAWPTIMSGYSSQLVALVCGAVDLPHAYRTMSIFENEAIFF